MGFFDFRPRIRPEGSKILSRMHWWLMFKIRWRIDFSKYIWYTSLSDWWSQNMMRICEFQNIIYIGLDSKKTTFCGTMHMDMNWTSFEPIFHSHNKIKAESANWQDFQTIDYSLFLEISKNSMTPPPKMWNQPWHTQNA